VQTVTTSDETLEMAFGVGEKLGRPPTLHPGDTFGRLTVI